MLDVLHNEFLQMVTGHAFLTHIIRMYRKAYSAAYSLLLKTQGVCVCVCLKSNDIVDSTSYRQESIS